MLFRPYKRELLRSFTFEAADAAHGSEDGGFHLDVSHSSFIRFLQILQLLLVREGAESSIQPALTCTATEMDLLRFIPKCD